MEPRHQAKDPRSSMRFKSATCGDLSVLRECVAFQRSKLRDIATSASTRNQLVGIDGACECIDCIDGDNEQFKYDKSMGSNTRIDAFTAALASIKVVLNMVVSAVYAGAMLPRASKRTIYVFTDNRTVLTTLQTLGRGSGRAISGKFFETCEVSGSNRQSRNLCMGSSQPYL
jgi:hypothetical protein